MSKDGVNHQLPSLSQRGFVRKRQLRVVPASGGMVIFTHFIRERSPFVSFLCMAGKEKKGVNNEMITHVCPPEIPFDP
jgi:hypothetical protein